MLRVINWYGWFGWLLKLFILDYINSFSSGESGQSFTIDINHYNTVEIMRIEGSYFPAGFNKNSYFCGLDNKLPINPFSCNNCNLILFFRLGRHQHIRVEQICGLLWSRENRQCPKEWVSGARETARLAITIDLKTNCGTKRNINYSSQI